MAPCLPHPWPKDDQNCLNSGERGDPILWSPRSSTVGSTHQPLATFDERHLWPFRDWKAKHDSLPSPMWRYGWTIQTDAQNNVEEAGSYMYLCSTVRLLSIWPSLGIPKLTSWSYRREAILPALWDGLQDDDWSSFAASKANRANSCDCLSRASNSSLSTAQKLAVESIKKAQRKFILGHLWPEGSYLPFES